MMKTGDIKLTVKQSRKVSVLEQLSKGSITNAEAASLLHLSVRHVQRLKKRFMNEGYSSLVHGNTGRKPNHTIIDHIREVIVDKAMNEYRGASACHFSELLKERDSIFVSAKTVGRILGQFNIKRPHSHKGPKKRLRRPRRVRRGELVQIDASPFDWLSCGVMMSMHGAIDDATGEVLSLWLAPTEQTRGYFHVLERMLSDYGIPRAIYMDGHTIFFSPQQGKLTIEDELDGKTAALSQFGMALEALGIQPLRAYSPQAKGRIERLWGTLQLRLSVELRLAGIHTIDEANNFLLSYKTKHNNRFSVLPQEEENVFLPAPSPELLRYILCTREKRTAARDSTFSWHGKTYAAEIEPGMLKLFAYRASLEVLCLMDGTVAVQEKGNIYHAIEVEKQNKIMTTAKEKKVRTWSVPAADHPWRGSHKNAPACGRVT